jgi:hypothetical protein
VTALTLLASLPARPGHATILLFDQERDAATASIVGPTSSGGRLPSDYGDHVTGAVMAVPGGFFTYGDGGEGFTPDVAVDVFTADATPGDSHARLWQTGYGDLVNVVFGEGPGIGGSAQLNVRLSAAPGFVVDLYGFELAGWPEADFTIAAVEVLAGAATLFSAADVLVEGNASGPRHTTFAFGPPLSAPEILVRLDLSNLAVGARDNVGIDSIRFGQTPPPIPEPGTAALLLCGIAATAAARRRGGPGR